MDGYSIRYDVSIEFAHAYWEYDASFDNEENARDYIDRLFEDVEDFCDHYRITKIETSGGMIVNEEVIDEWEYVPNEDWQDEPEEDYEPEED